MAAFQHFLNMQFCVCGGGESSARSSVEVVLHIYIGFPGVVYGLIHGMRTGAAWVLAGLAARAGHTVSWYQL